MSDTADDVGFRGRGLLNESDTDPLREAMREFVEDHDEASLKALRGRVARGDPLSEVVDRDREERV